MKITLEGDAQEFAALVNEVNENDGIARIATGVQTVRSISVTEPKPTLEPDTDEIIAAFKKMTLERIKRLETHVDQDPDEIRAVRECIEFITAFEFDDDDDTSCVAI